jgi:transcriptional regulator of arginine metabolism
MDNLYRRTQILELLRTETVATQSDLRRKLERRGIRVTQATVSRDIEELGIIKTREGYRVPNAAPTAAPPQPTLAVILKEFLREVRLAANMVIIKTHPGNAHSVAVALDAEDWSEVMGTVAGDDTVFIATAGGHEASRLQKKIMALLAT